MLSSLSFLSLQSEIRMIGIKICLLLFVVLCESRQSLVPQAIMQLVQNHFGESPVNIEVFYNSDRIKILEQTLKLLSAVKNLKVINTESKNCNFTLKKNAIFIFDTLENYLKFVQVNKKVRLALKGDITFLVYCSDCKRRTIQSAISADMFERFLVEENNRISLNAVSMFTEKKCREAQLIEINQYSNSIQKWKTEKFLDMIIDNFHGCEFIINIFSDDFPYMFFEVVDEESDAVVGAEGVIVEMIKALANDLNFTICFNRRMLGVGADAFFGIIELSHLTNKLLALSDPIYSASKVFVVPPGEPYTSWEKVFLPFDQPTWFWLGTTFGASFLIILFMKLSGSTSMHDFVVGSNVSTPALNVVAIFMGIGQIKLPHRNIARFLFIAFVLFCLIMRTAYQGKYFEFLTSDMSKKPIATMQELIERNFTVFYDLDSSFDRNDEMLKNCIKEK